MAQRKNTRKRKVMHIAKQFITKVSVVPRFGVITSSGKQLNEVVEIKTFHVPYHKLAETKNKLSVKELQIETLELAENHLKVTSEKLGLKEGDLYLIKRGIKTSKEVNLWSLQDQIRA